MALGSSPGIYNVSSRLGSEGILLPEWELKTFLHLQRENTFNELQVKKRLYGLGLGCTQTTKGKLE